MIKTTITSICFFLFSTFIQTDAANPAGNNEIKKVVSVLETALKNKDRKLFESCVTPDFSVSTVSMPIALQYVANIWNHTPQIDSIRVDDTQKTAQESEGTTVKMKFFVSGQPPITSEVRFNKAYKIRYIGYFDQLYGMYRDRPSKLRAVIPFEFEENAIVVTLRLNDSERPLRFIFDTGADGMAISQELADLLGLAVSHEQNTSVVGTNLNISVSTNNTVHFDTLSLPHQSIALFEKMDRHDGILGLNLAKFFIVKVDFEKLQLSLYDLGSFTPSPKETIIPVTVPDGLVRIPCELDLLGKGAVEGSFVLDTGAGFNVVAFSPFVRKNRLLLSGFKYESQNSLISMGQASHVYQGKACDFSFGGIHIENMPISLQASTGSTDWDPGASGSIGIGLLSQYNFTINLVEKEIYMKKN